MLSLSSALLRDLGSLMLLSELRLSSNGRRFSGTQYVTRFAILNLASDPNHPYFTDEDEEIFAQTD